MSEYVREADGGNGVEKERLLGVLSQERIGRASHRSKKSA